MFGPLFITGQTLNFISGYSYTLPDFAQVNDAIAIRNSVIQWDTEFPTIKNLHGVQFGLRRISDRGFIGISWEQKLKTIKAERTNASNKEINERMYLAINALNLETGLKIGFLHAGIGLQASSWTAKYRISSSNKRTPLFQDFNLGNMFFLEIDIGRPTPIQLSLRPFYQLSWVETNYQNLNYYLGGLTPDQKAYNDFWGVSILIKNGPKIK